MKARVRRIINEARVQRTIDSKIWASMSSMSSRLRSTLALEAKPMKRDTKDILLQKYVAGLLTMKVNCPNNVNDISKNKAYQHFGNAFIEAGGTIQEIQKLYQENGGVLTNSFHNDSDDFNDINEPEDSDYPEYDNIHTTDKEFDFDNAISNYSNKPAAQDYPDYNEVDDIEDEKPMLTDYPEYNEVDDIEDKKPILTDYPEYDEVDDIEDEKPILTDYPEYDEVDDTENDINISEKILDELDVENYIKAFGKQLTYIKPGTYLNWSNLEGLIISDEENSTTIAQCVGSSFNFLDKKPRFMFAVSNEDIRLNNPGNKSKYDDYYYHIKDQRKSSRIQIIPGSSYYPLEEKKGELYTNILLNNNNGPAQYVKSDDNLTDIKFNGLEPELQNYFIKYFQEHAYLPTLPELAKAINYLDPEKYWTSSIENNGSSNIILQVNPDKVILTSNPSDKAKVITFIKF